MLVTPTTFDRSRKLFAQAIKGLDQYAEPLVEVISKRDLQRVIQSVHRLQAPFSIANAAVLICCGGFSSGKSELFRRCFGLDMASSRSPTTRLFSVVEPVEGIAEPVYEIGYIGVSEAWQQLLRVVDVLRAELGDSYHQCRRLIQQAESVKEAAGRLVDVISECCAACSEAEQRSGLVKAAWLCRSIQKFLDERCQSIQFQQIDAAEAKRVSAWGQGPLAIQFAPPEVASAEEFKRILDDWFDPSYVERVVRQRQQAGTKLDPEQLRQEHDTLVRIGIIGYLRARVPVTDMLQPGVAIADSPGAGASFFDRIKLKLLMPGVAGGFVFTNLSQPGSHAETVVKETLKEIGGKSGAVFTHADRLVGEAIFQSDHADTASDQYVSDAESLLNEFAQEMSLKNHSETALLLEDESHDWAGRLAVVYNLYGDRHHRESTEKLRRLRRLNGFLDLSRHGQHLPAQLQQFVASQKQEYPSPQHCLDDLVARLGLSERKVVRLIVLLLELADSGGFTAVGRMLRYVQQGSLEHCQEKIAASASDLIEVVHSLPIDEIKDTDVAQTLSPTQQQAITLLESAVNAGFCEARDLLKLEVFHRELLKSVGEPYMGRKASPAQIDTSQLVKAGLTPQQIASIEKVSHESADDGALPTLDELLAFGRTSIGLVGGRISLRDAATRTFDQMAVYLPRQIRFYFDRFASDLGARLAASVRQRIVGRLDKLKSICPQAMEINEVVVQHNATWQSFLGEDGHVAFAGVLAQQFGKALDGCLKEYWCDVFDSHSPFDSSPLRPFDRHRDVDAFIDLSREVCEHRLATVLLRSVTSLHQSATTEFRTLEAAARPCYQPERLLQACFRVTANDADVAAEQRRHEAIRLLRKLAIMLPQFAEQIKSETSNATTKGTT